MTAANPHKRAAQLGKATKLADFIQAQLEPETPSMRRRLIDALPCCNDDWWADTARQAGCNPPHSEESKRMVIEMLKRRSI